MTEYQNGRYSADFMHELFGLHPDAARDSTRKDIPYISDVSGIGQRARECYRELLARAVQRGEKSPFVPPLQTQVSRGQKSRLLLFDNPERVAAYIDRARNNTGEPPPKGNVSFHLLRSEEYIGRFKNGTTAAINRTPFTDDTVMFIPQPYFPEDENRAYLQNGKEKLIFERTQTPGFFAPSDFEFMGQLAQQGKMALWYNGATPSQKFLHYHGMADIQEGTQVPLTRAALQGAYSRTEIFVGADSSGREVSLTGFTTHEPEEAREKMYEFDKKEHPCDLFVVRGKYDPLYVLFPVYRKQNLKVTFFRESGQNWDWLPSAENAGFILIPSFVRLPQPGEDVVYVGNSAYKVDDFNASIFRTLNTKHPSRREMRQMAA